MLIKLLRNTVADGKLAGAGQVLTVTDATGKTLVQMGKAMVWAEPSEPPKPIEPVAVVEKAPDPSPLPASPVKTGEEPEAIAPAKPKGRQGKK